jgi:ethanolaminephosphotransferase
MPKPYQYNCNDRSITLPHLKRYLWTPALKYIPTFRSANSITLLGNVCSAVAFVFLALVPVTGAPDAAFVLPAAALFLYLSLDNIDGAQARRTMSSSPLGEFLDHWCDAFNLGFIVLGYGLAMRLETWILLLALSLCALAYYATMWEQRVTGWLNFGPIGSIEGILLISIMYLLVAIFGIDAIAGTPVLGPMTLSHLFVAITCASFTHIVISSILRVRAPLAEFVPLLITLLCGSLWYAFGDIGLLPAALFLVFASCLLGGRQIIARVFDAPYRSSDWVVLGGVVLGALGGIAFGWGYTEQTVLAWLLVAYVAIRLAGDFFTTVSRLADHLRPNELLGTYFVRPR